MEKSGAVAGSFQYVIISITFVIYRFYPRTYFDVRHLRIPTRLKISVARNLQSRDLISRLIAVRTL